MTATVFDADKAQGLQVGMSGLLTKPLTSSELFETLLSTLSRDDF